ncbi:hypothetical protein [Microbacterium sp. cf046]|uniref:hypothetical protein n=1 Tax=Microbacterium sp. cf046 TaxID=1761803 RepID=UPI001113FCE3|nr:hypothetical protein [Microbacterium sp. cf046]
MLVIGSWLGVSSSAPCSPDLAAIGACTTVSNSGEQVDIGASITNPAPPVTDQGDHGSPTQPEPQPAPQPITCTRADCGGFLVVTPPDVTAADLASFRPATPSLTGEPTGFGLVGAPTNVVASASEQLMTGTLLGWDVTVRFVPAGFVFDYGDGSTARFTTGGASWASLAQPQFTPTATSHVYRERGTYPVAVTVQYAASVDFGSGTWRPVTGYVTATSAGYDIRVVEARTALVDRTCIENPAGPGC